MNITQQIVILSAELETNTFEKNRQLTENLAACLDDCNFNWKKATGVYKGCEETCFVVIVNNQQEIDTLKDFAFKNFGQESILHQDSNQEAYLKYSTGKTEQLGRLEQINPKYIEHYDSYTILNGKIYITVPRIKGF
jgi:hypothetical protein